MSDNPLETGLQADAERIDRLERERDQALAAQRIALNNSALWKKAMLEAQAREAKLRDALQDYFAAIDTYRKGSQDPTVNLTEMYDLGLSVEEAEQRARDALAAGKEEQ